MDRPWFRDAPAAGTAPAHLRQLVHGSGQIIARVAPIIEMLRTAVAIDPDIAEPWPQEADLRFTVHATAARALVAKPGARPGCQPSTPPTCFTACSAPSCTHCMCATAAGVPGNGSNGPTTPCDPSCVPTDNRPPRTGCGRQQPQLRRTVS